VELKKEWSKVLIVQKSEGGMMNAVAKKAEGQSQRRPPKSPLICKFLKTDYM